MRSSKIIFAFLILFTAVQFCFGQEKPKAQLLDRFADIPCHHWRSRIDGFFIELQNNPTWTGYVILSSGKNPSKQALKYENIILGHAEFRKFSMERFIVIHAKKEEAEVELWKVAPGADKPPFVATEWSKILPADTKPFVFGDTYGYSDCHNFSAKLYADYLLSNPDVRGHIVVYDDSFHDLKNDGKFWLQILTKDFKIPPKRLRVFYAKAKDQSFPGTEFWLVPSRKIRAAKVLQ